MPIKPDVNWISYYGNNPNTEDFKNPPDPENYDDIVKFYRCTSAYFRSHTVQPGRENCIDATGCVNLTLTDSTFLPGAGISAFTIKGATDGWTIADSVIGHGKETDVELGQFDNSWYIGRPPTRNGLIAYCRSNDGRPIKVTCWNAEPPKVIGSRVKIVRVPWIVWFPYFCWRYIRHRWF